MSGVLTVNELMLPKDATPRKHLSRIPSAALIVLAIIGIGMASPLIQIIKTYAATPPTDLAQSQPSFAKNLQVLKFIKSKQELKSWMNMIKTSLGVDCDYCHNTDNFASDEKPTKRKARMMLKMLVQIRADYF
ncbi:MAG: photosynthetic reaction center cytochrome c subunit family protein [Candidatus Kryptoniota bacterium]